MSMSETLHALGQRGSIISNIQRELFYSFLETIRTIIRLNNCFPAVDFR